MRGSRPAPAAQRRAATARVYSRRHGIATRASSARHVHPCRSTLPVHSSGHEGTRRGTGQLAERVGFEPTDHLTVINALAGRPIRPLWHLSGAGAVYASTSVNGTGVGAAPAH